MTLENSPAAETAGPKFNIITKALSGGVDGDGKRRFRATASSTITDLDGDEVTLPALEKMANKFRQGVTIFMDHDFKHVDSAFGLTDGAEILQRSVDDKGAPVWDLDISGVVNTPNPRAAQLADSIDGGFVKLGASITARIKKHGRSKAGGYQVHDLDVIEASIVGVPSNQRSWAHKAAVAIKSFGFKDEDEDEEITVTKEIETTEAEDAKAEDEAEATETSETTIETESEDVAKAADTDDTISKAEDACPECGKGKDAEGCDNGYHTTAKSVDESTLGVQESEQETPETAPADALAETDPPVEKVASVSPEDVAALVRKTADLVKEIGHLRTENERLRGELVTQKDLNQAVSNEVELAKQVIGEVMKKPLQPKTAAFVKTFTGAHELFDPEIAEYLNKRGNA